MLCEGMENSVIAWQRHAWRRQVGVQAWHNWQSSTGDMRGHENMRGERYDLVFSEGEKLLARISHWEGTKSTNTEGNPSSHVPAQWRQQLSCQVGLLTMPLLLSGKNPFHFIVIKMLIDVLLTHSAEPHRFYNSSKHLQVVTCVRLSRQKWIKTLCTELLGRHIIP